MFDGACEDMRRIGEEQVENLIESTSVDLRRVMWVPTKREIDVMEVCKAFPKGHVSIEGRERELGEKAGLKPFKRCKMRDADVFRMKQVRRRRYEVCCLSINTWGENDKDLLSNPRLQSGKEHVSDLCLSKRVVIGDDD